LPVPGVTKLLSEKINFKTDRTDVHTAYVDNTILCQYLLPIAWGKYFKISTQIIITDILRKNADFLY
jgi:hypothetical protein